MVQAALDAMRKEYEELDAEPVRETIAGHDLVGFDLNFFCLDLTNTACIRSLRVAALPTPFSFRPKTANSAKSARFSLP